MKIRRKKAEVKVRRIGEMMKEEKLLDVAKTTTGQEKVESNIESKQ